MVLAHAKLLATATAMETEKSACFVKLKHLAALTTMGRKIAAHTTRSDQAAAMGFSLPTQVSSINHNYFSSGSRGHHGGPSRGRGRDRHLWFAPKKLGVARNLVRGLSL